MKLQVYSDLHLETEQFDPEPAPHAELLVLAGDIDSHWHGYRRFVGWPVPVVVVAGNHEFDGRDVDTALAGLRELCATFGFSFLERESLILGEPNGRRLRLLGTTRWSDFDLYGSKNRERTERAAAYFLRRMGSTREGREFDATAVRQEALSCRAWLETELSRLPQGHWDRTVVITHFAPSLRSADPRYGAQPGTGSFCNADDDLIPRADLWLHGHLHCRHDYSLARAGRMSTRVVCNAMGLAKKGENKGWEPLKLIEI